LAADSLVGNPIEVLKERAETGDAKAMHELGNRYLSGIGVEVDYEKSMRWYRKGAETGFALSMVAVGKQFEYGQGVERSLEHLSEVFGDTAL
jgi:TPR repeat protein